MASLAHPLTGWTDRGQSSPAHWPINRKSFDGTEPSPFKNRQSTAVVSQSWSEIHKVNERVRLRPQGTEVNRAKLKRRSRHWIRQDLTEAQKRDKRFYQPDSVLETNRPAAGFKSGSAGKLRGITDKHLLIEADNRIRPVPFKQLDKITVCQPKEFSCPRATACNSRPMLKARTDADLPMANWSR